MLRDDSDVRVLAIKARGEPFLPLPAIFSAPDFRHKVLWQVIGIPALALGKQLRPISSGFFFSTRRAALSGLSPSRMPPWGICHASLVISMRLATKTSPALFISMMPTPGR